MTQSEMKISFVSFSDSSVILKYLSEEDLWANLSSSCLCQIYEWKSETLKSYLGGKPPSCSEIHHFLLDSQLGPGDTKVIIHCE